MQQPTVSHPTGRPNLTVVTVGPLEITFSYRTPIAFRYGTEPQTVRENDWQQTTGKHLNYCDGGNKAARVSGAVFTERLAAVLERMDDDARAYEAERAEQRSVTP